MVMNRNASNANSTSNTELLRKIQALAFAKVETELYLDSHPECAVALDYYKNLIRDYTNLVNQYENTHGPIRQENVSDESWTWVNSPWPWQLEGNGREI